MSESEEKTLEASDKKLRDARRKGQVAQFQDLLAFTGLAAGLGLLWASVPGTVGFFREMFDVAFAGIAEARAESYLSVLGVAQLHAASLLGSLMGLLAATAVLTSLVAQKGLVFSLDPLVPKLSKMDPVQGIKRIFGVRGLVELAKNLVRFVAALVVIWLVARESAAALIQAPACGLRCLAETLLAVASVLFAALLLLAAVFAVPDVWLQTALFKRDQKMGRSEMKREQKDVHGSPEIRGARARLRKEAAEVRTRMGVRHASLVIYGARAAVGLRYVRDEVPVPMVVALARGAARADDLLLRAQMSVVPLFHDDALAEAVAAIAKPGHPAPQSQFEGIAGAMAQLHIGT